MEELWRWEAIEIARAVRTQQISSREAVSACLERTHSIPGRNKERRLIILPATINTPSPV